MDRQPLADGVRGGEVCFKQGNLKPLLSFVRQLHSLKSKGFKAPECLECDHPEEATENKDSGNCEIMSQMSEEIDYWIDEAEDSVSSSEGDQALMTPQGRKRQRVEGEVIDESSCASFPTCDCEVFNPHVRSSFSLRLEDPDLSHHGLRAFTMEDMCLSRNGCPPIGARCCYFLQSAARIVTGCVVDVCRAELTLHIAPDKGMNADLAWVHMDLVYHLPDEVD
uniref:Uncharacterized protein n=1 Tax=Trypanosoma congolense (strain IL3000) TaxID=1068625 RepID=G0UVS6_TRYCI|nr:conserved hypothetical protein [Trypanosoma congolense IL3000]